MDLHALAPRWSISARTARTTCWAMIVSCIADGLDLVPGHEDLLRFLAVDRHHRDATLDEEVFPDARLHLARVDLARPAAGRDERLMPSDLEDLCWDGEAHFGDPN